MIYLKSFSLLDENQEHILLETDRRNIFNNYYPLHIFSDINFKEIIFDNITIFCGGNGCGKSTLLNIIAEKINALRKTKYEKGALFNLYVDMCSYETNHESPIETKVVTSDDVFDYLLDIRSINANVNRKKEYLSKEYLNKKYNTSDSSYEEYEELKNSLDAKTKTMSKYVRQRLGNNNLQEYSNGESALMFWEKEIKEDSIYILDEPENSLSAENQIKLKNFIEQSARFYNCQFIIATHSPFILSLNYAKIYDLDSNPVICKNWSEVPNVITYYNFFKEHKDDFKNK